MHHVIMKNKTERIIGVVGTPGNYHPAFVTRHFFAPSMDMSFEVRTTQLKIEDLTEGELKQYASLLERMPVVS